jgi:hypothetical protein
MKLNIIVVRNSSLPTQEPKRKKLEVRELRKYTPKVKGKQFLGTGSLP